MGKYIGGQKNAPVRRRSCIRHTVTTGAHVHKRKKKEVEHKSKARDERGRKVWHTGRCWDKKEKVDAPRRTGERASLLPKSVGGNQTERPRKTTGGGRQTHTPRRAKKNELDSKAAIEKKRTEHKKGRDRNNPHILDGEGTK